MTNSRIATVLVICLLALVGAFTLYWASATPEGHVTGYGATCGPKVPPGQVPPGIRDPEPCSDEAHAKILREMGVEPVDPYLTPDGRVPVPGVDVIHPRKGFGFLWDEEVKAAKVAEAERAAMAGGR